MLFSRVLIATAAAAIVGVESFAPVISSSRSCQKIVSSQCYVICMFVVLYYPVGRGIRSAAATQLAEIVLQ